MAKPYSTGVFQRNRILDKLYLPGLVTILLVFEDEVELFSCVEVCDISFILVEVVGLFFSLGADVMKKPVYSTKFFPICLSDTTAVADEACGNLVELSSTDSDGVGTPYASPADEELAWTVAIDLTGSEEGSVNFFLVQEGKRGAKAVRELEVDFSTTWTVPGAIFGSEDRSSTFLLDQDREESGKALIDLTVAFRTAQSTACPTAPISASSAAAFPALYPAQLAVLFAKLSTGINSV
jgi:hypothetical protein